MSFFASPLVRKGVQKRPQAFLNPKNQIVFRALHPAVAALLGGKLLLQSGLAVIQQQILVVLEIPLAAVLSEELVRGGVHRKLGDEHYHLLTFRKGLLHKVEGGFQRSSGGLLGSFALVRQRTELTAQQVEGLLCTGGVGAAQLPFPLVQRGLHLQTVGQLCLAQQSGIALLLGLSLVVLDLLAEQFRRAVRDILRQGSQRLFGLPQKA